VRHAWLPPLLLAIYGLAFAGKALGGLLVFDDHPGQLYRIAHALTVGLSPWRLNPGWWAGYAELQFYPPGFSYAGALLHWASLGALDLSATYQVLLWVTFLLPGASTYVLLLRVLKSPWLALPGAFLALTLSAGSRSGVEEGMRWGLVAARLGWGLVPLLALVLHRATERAALPIAAAPLLATIILVHPAHAPAGVALVFLAAWHGPGSRLACGRRAVLLVGAAAGLAAFWLLPLLAHLAMALPLAWGEPSPATLARSIGTQPLVLCLVAASLVAWTWRRTESAGSTAPWLADLAPVLAGIIAVDVLVAQPLGMMWLPADRLLDSFFLALILGTSLALAAVHRRVPGLPPWSIAMASIVLCALLSGGSRAEPTLSLWPRSWPNEWPKYEVVARGLRLPELWEALRQVPPGRILFLRSGVPLEYRPDWRRPHSHLTALTPLRTGREILNGTFTHPSPIAGLLYTGSPANRPITLLVEQRDGVTLFGQPLADLGSQPFNDLADRLRVSAVVALDEDQGHIDFVARNSAFTGPARIGPFLLFVSREPRPTPAPVGDQLWRFTPPTQHAGWVSTGMAYTPLWRGRAGSRLLLTRRDALGLLEVNTPLPGATAIELEHRPGAAEWAGLAASGVSAVALLLARRRWRTSLRRADRS
jgi:hypothetical protein